MGDTSEADNRTCKEVYTELIRELRALREFLMAEGNGQLERPKGAQFGAGMSGVASPAPVVADALRTRPGPSTPSSVPPPKAADNMIDRLTGPRLCEALARIDDQGELTLFPKDDCVCKALYDGFDEIPGRFLKKRTIFRGDSSCET